MLRKLYRRLRMRLRRGRIEREMERELRFHVEMETAENMRRGMSEEEARRAARRSFGGVEPVKEAYRDGIRFRRLEEFLQDVRYGARMLLKTPGFTAVATLTLALGIGANTAIFSVVYATLLKPLPYPEAERIYGVEMIVPERGMSLPGRIQDYLEWRKANTAFSSVAALRPGGWNLTGNGEPERINGANVTTNFFEFLGIPPALGRGFVPEEEVPGADRVVVISDALWRRRYGANPNLVGGTIDLNGQAHLVVGIAAPSMLVPTGTQIHSVLGFAPRVDLWKPIAPTKTELEDENWNTGLLLRLNAGESVDRGRLQLDTMLNATIPPDVKLSLRSRLMPIREIYSGKFRLRLLLVFAASAMLLLTACATLANLLLARFAGRSGEFAIRTALGAGRVRLLAQVLTENSMLAIVGGVVGIAAAYSTAGLLAAYDPAVEKMLSGSPLNLPVLLFAMALAFMTSVVCGVFPAMRASRADAAQALKEGSVSVAGGKVARVQFALVTVQIALGTALLASAGLLLHSFVRLARVDRGYDVEQTLAFDLSLPGRTYSTTEQRVGFYRHLTENIRAIPGVEAVGAISDLPAMGVSGSQTIFYETDTDFENAVPQRPVAGQRSVGPGYFSASMTALKTGRLFTEQDQTPVAVISEALAKRLWPDASLPDVLGRGIREGSVTGPVTVIVGVVGDVRLGSVERDLPPQLYRPHHQRDGGRMTMVVRASGQPSAPAALASGLRSEVRKLEPNLPITGMRPMKEIVSASIAQRRFEMLLTSVFAVVALLLGVIGVYGVVSYSVTHRTRDIALRMALGATPRDVTRWVLAHGLRSVLIGAFVGLCGAVFMATSLRSLLFAVAPTDPLTLVTISLILLCASALACYLPARRASRLNPADLLRN